LNALCGLLRLTLAAGQIFADFQAPDWKELPGKPHWPGTASAWSIPDQLLNVDHVSDDRIARIKRIDALIHHT
jgi:hypothetical protein